MFFLFRSVLSTTVVIRGALVLRLVTRSLSVVTLPQGMQVKLGTSGLKPPRHPGRLAVATAVRACLRKSVRVATTSGPVTFCPARVHPWVSPTVFLPVLVLEP